MCRPLPRTPICLVVGLYIAGWCGISGSCQNPATPLARAARLNNLGVAYLNQQMGDKALDLFHEAIAADATAGPPHLNAGITLVNLQQQDAASVEMKRAAALNPKDPRAWYNLGLLERSQNQVSAEMEDFSHVLEIEPNNADAHYYLGLAYSTRMDYPKAIAEFERALDISPLHASAEFGLARALQRSGDSEGARKHLEHFQQVTRDKLATPLSQSYGEQGAYSVAEEMNSPAPTAGPMIPVVLRPMPLAAGAPNTGALCLIDLEGHGRPSILATTEDGLTLYTKAADGTFLPTPGEKIGLRIGKRAVACAVGDLDSDGRPDVLVATDDQVLIFRNTGDGRFEDISIRTGIALHTRPSGLTLVDYDHDGDLDLLVTGSAREGDRIAAPNALWRNNGNLTFTDRTEATQLGGHGATNAAVLSDLNNDRAVDLVMTSGKAGVTLYLNQREGGFLSVPLYPAATLPPAMGVAVLDYNKDGWMDLAITHDGTPALTLWRNVEGKRFEQVPLPALPLEAAAGVTALDLDNDGWVDLAVAGAGEHGNEVRVLRNLGTGAFTDISQSTEAGAKAAVPGQTIVAADLDGDGDADLLVGGHDHAPTWLRNDGGNRNHSVQIVLHGFADNKSAIGTKVEVFAGGIWQKWEVSSSSGYAAQGTTGILAGLGQATHPDVVRMLWPTGVPQDEIAKAPAATMEVTELDRRGSSCPVLFAWDGAEYRFVADTIGAAVVGHWVSPTKRNMPDPDEWIKVADTQLRPYKGNLSLRIGEPMEEVNYLDQVRLIAVDHPAGTEVYPNERFENQPPFADGRAILARDAHAVKSAQDSQAHDVTDLLKDRDHRFVRDFSNLPYAGFANTHSLLLDIGEWNAENPLRLLMTGFIEYFSASSMYAASQAGVQQLPPYIEAQMVDGTWKRIVEDMGFPAGLTRTIVVDLTGKLPPGATRLRITTNLQIYWDQILVANSKDAAAEIRSTEVPLRSATLAARGYPRQVDGETPGDLTYRYDEVSATGPFQHQSGAYTRFGDVTPLLRAVDDEFAIFGTGEDVDLEFASSSLPALTAGWKRDYFFYANGYVKDMDYYEALPYTVSELPFHRMAGYPYATDERRSATPAQTDYELRWNSRMELDVRPQTYQFDYKPRVALPEITP